MWGAGGIVGPPGAGLLMQRSAARRTAGCDRLSRRAARHLRALSFNRPAGAGARDGAKPIHTPCLLNIGHGMSMLHADASLIGDSMTKPHYEACIRN